MDSGKVVEKTFVLVVDTEGVDDGAYELLEVYADGDARVRAGKRQVIVPKGQWTECKE